MTTTYGKRYPIFVPHQILRHSELNELAKDLDSHEQLTRTYLIGMGIVKGMEVSFSDANQSVKVTAGCGITSEGYLIVLPEDVDLKYYRNLTHPSEKVSNHLFWGSPVEGEQSREAEVYSAEELFQEGNEAQQPISEALKEDSALLQNKILVIAYERYQQEQDLCTDPDGEGSRINHGFRLRFFLVPPDVKPGRLTANELGIGVEAANTFQARTAFFKNHNPRILRFGYVDNPNANQPDLVRLDDIENYETFLKRYYDICIKAIEEIGKTFPELYQLLLPFFIGPQVEPTENFSQIQTKLKTKLKNLVPTHIHDQPADKLPVDWTEAGRQLAIQYFYDYLNILITAYHELAEAAFDLIETLLPGGQHFPRFLMLGLVISKPSSEGWPLSPYRSYFCQPPIYNGNRDKFQRLQHLYHRLRCLCQTDSFNLKLDAESWSVALMRVTPSNLPSSSLDEQAIPYYLDYQSIYTYWNYDAYRKGISDLQPAYYSLEDTTAPAATTTQAVFRNPEKDLIYRLDNYNFYRIEGHIGKNKDFLKKIIELFKEGGNYNLTFDILPLVLARQTNDLQAQEMEVKDASELRQIQDFHEFAKEHPGMEPLGGVPKGGTFIIVFAHLDDILNGDITAQQAEISPQNTNASASQSPQLLSTSGTNGQNLTPIWHLIINNIESMTALIWLLFIYQSSPYVAVADFCLPYRCYDDLSLKTEIQDVESKIREIEQKLNSQKNDDKTSEGSSDETPSNSSDSESPI